MTFGDFDPDDALDREPADPEQVARFLHGRRRREGLERIDWDDLDELTRLVLIAVIGEMLAWLRRQGSTP